MMTRDHLVSYRELQKVAYRLGELYLLLCDAAGMAVCIVAGVTATARGSSANAT